MQTYINEVAVVRAWHFGVWVLPIHSTHTLPRFNSGLDTSTDVILPTASHRIARNLMIYSLNKPRVIFQVKIFRRRCRHGWMEWVCFLIEACNASVCYSNKNILKRTDNVLFTTKYLHSIHDSHRKLNTEWWEPRARVQRTFSSLPATLSALCAQVKYLAKYKVSCDRERKFRSV